MNYSNSSVSRELMLSNEHLNCWYFYVPLTGLMDVFLSCVFFVCSNRASNWRRHYELWSIWLIPLSAPASIAFLFSIEAVTWCMNSELSLLHLFPQILSIIVGWTCYVYSLPCYVNFIMEVLSTERLPKGPTVHFSVIAHMGAEKYPRSMQWCKKKLDSMGLRSHLAKGGKTKTSRIAQSCTQMRRTHSVASKRVMLRSYKCSERLNRIKHGSFRWLKQRDTFKRYETAIGSYKIGRM
jgi:hypothetical protein